MLTNYQAALQSSLSVNMVPQSSVETLVSPALHLGSSLLSPRFAYHDRKSGLAAFGAGRYGLRLPSDPARFSKPNQPFAVRLPVRCSYDLMKVATFLHEKIGEKIGPALRGEIGDLETVSATVRILREGAFDVGSHTLSDMMGEKVKMFLVSLDEDPETNKGKLSSETDLKFAGREGTGEEKGDTLITVLFSIPKDFGRPGAILIESLHSNEFFLKTIGLDMPDGSRVHFPCYSWIVESKLNLNRPRVFFANQAYLPNETPPALVKYRQEDLISLRGDGKGERKYGERIYDYDVYNDLGNPDQSLDLARPVLGGSAEYPYPRRCRTGRKRTKKDPASEVPVALDDNYLPRDERYSPLRKSLFVAAGVRCLSHEVLPVFHNLLDENRAFQTLDEIKALYVGQLRSVATDLSSILRDPRDGTTINFPPPGVVEANTEAWRSDPEFGRQRLAGANPVSIERLQVFPPVSSLDPEMYGPATSSLTEKHLEPGLEGLSVKQAMEQKRLFILDYHDIFMPFVSRINKLSGKIYGSRTILFVNDNGYLIPLAIELSLPPECNGDKGLRRVITPHRRPGVTDWLWQLAKTHATAHDCGVHQLSSHWLRTHAIMEPFIIATRRHMSTMHPLHVLLSPHFKDTMNINAMARASLLHCNDIVEKLFTPGRYCGEISSAAYKGWRFDQEALPKDLLKRGVAEVDPNSKHGLKLTIEDYPFAVDALELWAAIQRWVSEYVAIYYKDDKAVQQDTELQSWWTEVTTVGHADKAGAEWWVKMSTKEELVEVITTLIWLASGHHAAVNFGQYAYAGFMPNFPSMICQLIPEERTEEYEKMLKNPESFLLKTLSSQGQAALAMATVEILAQHMIDEEYLGERNDPEWTSNSGVLEAFKRFQRDLVEVEAKIEEWNACEQHFHRTGAVLLPYTLLMPSSDAGLTFRGVPNSISM